MRRVDTILVDNYIYGMQNVCTPLITWSRSVKCIYFVQFLNPVVHIYFLNSLLKLFSFKSEFVTISTNLRRARWTAGWATTGWTAGWTTRRTAGRTAGRAARWATGWAASGAGTGCRGSVIDEIIVLCLFNKLIIWVIPSLSKFHISSNYYT